MTRAPDRRIIGSILIAFMVIGIYFVGSAAAGATPSTDDSPSPFDFPAKSWGGDHNHSDDKWNDQDESWPKEDEEEDCTTTTTIVKPTTTTTVPATTTSTSTTTPSTTSTTVPVTTSTVPASTSTTSTSVPATTTSTTAPTSTTTTTVVKPSGPSNGPTTPTSTDKGLAATGSTIKKLIAIAVGLLWLGFIAIKLRQQRVAFS